MSEEHTNDGTAKKIILNLELLKKKPTIYCIHLFLYGSEIITKVYIHASPSEHNTHQVHCYKQYRVEVVDTDEQKNMCDLIINNDCFKDIPVYGDKLPLMVDYYSYTTDGYSQLSASATIFNVNEHSYSLLDMMAFGKDDEIPLTAENFNIVKSKYSIGNVVLIDEQDTLIKYPNPKSMLEIQDHFYEQINQIGTVDNLEFIHPSVEAIANTPKYLPFRSCPRVYVNNFLKYFETLSKLPPKLQNSVQEKEKVKGKLSLKDFVILGIDWIKTEKGYHNEWHYMINDEVIKCDNWASLEEQGVGNCKNMAITMFQFCSFYFPDKKFYLCACILKDNYGPHAVCLTFDNDKPFIIDATRIEFKYGDMDYIKSEYEYFVTLFPKDTGALFLVKDDRIGITVDEFYKGDYKKHKKNRPDTTDKLLNYIVKFKHNNY